MYTIGMYSLQLLAYMTRILLEMSRQNDLTALLEFIVKFNIKVVEKKELNIAEQEVLFKINWYRTLSAINP